MSEKYNDSNYRPADRRGDEERRGCGAGCESFRAYPWAPDTSRRRICLCDHSVGARAERSDWSVCAESGAPMAWTSSSWHCWPCVTSARGQTTIGVNCVLRVMHLDRAIASVDLSAGFEQSEGDLASASRSYAERCRCSASSSHRYASSS
jgi:hypothetical protein